MKFLYVAGESANWVINLCNEFCKKGHEVTCVVQQVDEYDSENKIEEHKNLTRINVDYNVMFHPSSLKKELENQGQLYVGYDFVFGSHAPITPVLEMLSQELEVNWGVMLLDIPTDLMIEDEYRRLQWKFWFGNMRSAEQVVFNTHVARDEYANFTGVYYSDNNVVTYATSVPKEFAMSGSTIKGDYVVSASRLTHIKNISMITRALAYLNKPIKQVVIGRDRGDLHTIMSVAKEHGVQVEHKEMVSEAEKFSLIKNSLCLVYPQKTAYIGGLSAWESMMIGKPTICSNYKVLHDLYKNHIDYFDINSIKELASKIDSVYTDDYNIPKLQFASDYAYEEASFSTMATKLLKIMSNIKGD